MEALRAQRTHPAALWFGPAYGVTERTEAGWLMSAMSDPTPQAARDGLGWWFRVLARRRSTPEADREEYWSASALLEAERRNELLVAGRRFRVVRVDRFFRYGLGGPEPPRPGDPDESPVDARHTRMLTGGLLGPGEEPGGKALLGERWEVVPRGPMVPPDVTHDARTALRTHPRVALLTPMFAVTEERDGHWPPITGAIPSPADARRALATYLRDMAPVLSAPSEEELTDYHRAASLLGSKPVHQVRAAGRRFRVIRLETAVRVGPDGPEPPRPSDHDPDPPLTGETDKLRTWDLIDDE